MSSIVEVHQLQSPDDETKAAQLVRAIATAIGDLDGTRKAEKAPWLAGGREVDDAFAAPLAALRRVEDMIRDRLREASKVREAARLAALASASTAARAGDAVGANAALATVPVEPVRQGVAERWTWEPVGFELSQVPADFLMIDLTKIRAYVKDCVRTGAVPNVPGIRFERTVDLTVRKL